MTSRVVALALCLAGALAWLFRLASGEPLFADLGFVFLGVGIAIGVVATVAPADCEYGFLEGTVGAYCGAVAPVTYRFLARPRSSLDTRGVGDAVGVLDPGIAVPEATIAVAVATAFAVGLAGGRREHVGALFLAAPPAIAALVSLTGSDAVGASAAFVVTTLVAVSAGTLFYAGRYLRDGSASAVPVGFA